jgi:hypothetical protein
LFWKSTLIAEHKSRGKDLGKAHSQAMQYVQDLVNEGRNDEVPRYVIVSDFARIALHDLEAEAPAEESFVFELPDLHRHVNHFAFIPGYKQHKLEPEDPVNIQAVKIMGDLHDALEAGGYSGHDLERLLVRILFCLFAEDTGIFERESFTLYLENHTREDGSDLGPQLARLFDVLNRPRERRQKNLLEELASLPYVNGELYAEPLSFAEFNRDLRNRLLACTKFDWSRISPAVFGALFQAVMEPPERRQIGAHYTSERDILKVIGPLFLDELKSNLAAAGNDARKLKVLHDRLARMRLLDPACGCGNFLVISYRELRLLELEIVRRLYKKEVAAQPRLDVINTLLKVDVDQMYGIEIEEWPVRIAEVAMWLMDHQMNQRVSQEFGEYYVRLPLRKSPHIHHGNALRIDWNDILPAIQCSFVLGNPPFVGKKEQNADQKWDVDHVWGAVSGSGILDYVTCWYFKAVKYSETKPEIRIAFVSTNSITQGEQVPILWMELFRRGVRILIAHRTFPWQSEARGKAHVHVVIVGFGLGETGSKQIYEYPDGSDEPVAIAAGNINPYLIDGPTLVVEKRMRPLCNVPAMIFGTKLVDNGHFVLNDVERATLIEQCPDAEAWIRPFTGSEEFIKGYRRWVLWLDEVSPRSLRRCRPIMDRVERVRAFRSASKKLPTVELARTPTKAGENRQPTRDYLLVPKVSSERRNYVPLGFLPSSVVANGSSLVIPDANTFHFGVLSSEMHMAWMRQLCGRMKSDYQYSATIIYNNLPWPQDVSDAKRAAVEEAAQGVLDARAAHPDATLADLYDPLSAPAGLARAHAKLDRAVDRCYRSQPFASERNRVEYLFTLYQQLSAPLLPPPKRSRRKSTA